MIGGAIVLMAALAAWLQFSGHGAGRRRIRTSLREPRGRSGSTKARVGGCGTAAHDESGLSRCHLWCWCNSSQPSCAAGGGITRLWEELWIVHGSRQITDGGPAVVAQKGECRAVARVATGTCSSTGSVNRWKFFCRRHPWNGRKGVSAAWKTRTTCVDGTGSMPGHRRNQRLSFSRPPHPVRSSTGSRRGLRSSTPDGARRPKATVRLLSWLPVFGLGLGMALGVDPLGGILLNNFLGVATFAAGLFLTVAGRVWSSRLVASAAGGC